jgi:hypothetical protein
MKSAARLAVIRSRYFARRAASCAALAAAGIFPAPAAPVMPRVWVAKQSPAPAPVDPADLLPADFVPAPVADYVPMINEVPADFRAGLSAFLADCDKANGGSPVECLLLTA